MFTPRTGRNSIVFKGTIPLTYGTCFCEIIKNRINYVFNIEVPDKELYQRYVDHWKTINKGLLNKTGVKGKKRLAEMERGERPDVIQLPHRRMYFHEALEKGLIYKNIDDGFTVEVRDYNPKWLDNRAFSKELTRELKLAISIGLLKFFLESNFPNANPAILVTCAAITGMVKGIVKCSSGTLSLLPQKCLIEVLAEVNAECFVLISGQKLSPFCNSATKAVCKYFWEQVIKGTFILATLTEALFEAIKLGFRAFVRTTVSDYLATQIVFVRMIGSILGSLLGVLIFELFVGQAFL